MAVVGVDLTGARPDDSRMAAAKQPEQIEMSMPNPEREVNRVVSHLMRNGETQLNACVAVMNAASHARYNLGQIGITDCPWLDHIYEYAHACVSKRRSEVGITDGARR